MGVSLSEGWASRVTREEDYQTEDAATLQVGVMMSPAVASSQSRPLRWEVTWHRYYVVVAVVALRLTRMMSRLALETKRRETMGVQQSGPLTNEGAMEFLHRMDLEEGVEVVVLLKVQLLQLVGNKVLVGNCLPLQPLPLHNFD